MTDTLSEIANEFKNTQALLGDLQARLTEAERRAERAEIRAARPGAGARSDGETPAHFRSRPLETSRLLRVSTEAAAEFKTFLKLGTKALASNVGSDGGFAVREELQDMILDQMIPSNPMRAVSRVVRATSSDFKQLVGRRGAASGWVGEGDNRTETNTPNLAEVAPTFGSVYAYPRASEEVLNAAFFDLESWLQLNVSDEMGVQENIAFTTGNGTNRPTGFLSGPAPVVTADATRAFGTLQYIPGGAASDFTPTNSADALISMMYTLGSPYRVNAVWMANSATISRMRRFKATDGQYLWQPAISLAQPETFLGYPVVANEAMPDVAANAFPIAFGDFSRGYLVADLMDLRVTRDEITTPGQIKFYARRRVGGRICDSNAIKLLRISTT